MYRRTLPSLGQTFDVGVTVPCLNEETSVYQLLESLSASATHNQLSAICVLVINHRESHSDDIKRDNLSLLASLRKKTRYPGVTLLPIDRCTIGKEFPEKQGVGLARKIGADILLKLYFDKTIKSPWFRTTDADVEVPLDYLAPLKWRSPVAGFGDALPLALTYPFQHALNPKDPVEMKALEAYESFLHFYVKGLKWAGSPYAFYAIGSTLAFTAEGYTLVRGFPKREAAEDFHFLNKMARVGHIAEISSEPIRIAQRRSQRVPFGTGRSTITISELFRENKPYLVFDPHSFLWLKELLSRIEQLAKDKDLRRFTTSLSPSWLKCLEELGVIIDFEKVLPLSKETDSTRRHLHTSFDGLKTVQWLRKISQKTLPLISVDSALVKIGNMIPTLSL
jgi:hypothetical protein